MNFKDLIGFIEEFMNRTASNLADRREQDKEDVLGKKAGCLLQKSLSLEVF